MEPLSKSGIVIFQMQFLNMAGAWGNIILYFKKVKIFNVYQINLFLFQIWQLISLQDWELGGWKLFKESRSPSGDKPDCAGHIASASGTEVSFAACRCEVASARCEGTTSPRSYHKRYSPSPSTPWLGDNDLKLFRSLKRNFRVFVIQLL